MKEYERHEFSYAWPEIATGNMGVLVQSMQTNGFDPGQPIVLYEGQILDGWNRYRAAARAGVEPLFTEFEGDDMAALSFAEMRNSARRHLTKGQQATAMVKIDLQRPQAARRSPEEIAVLTKASASTVRNAVKLMEVAPDVADDVIKGKKPFEVAVREEVTGENERSVTKTVTATPAVSIKLLERLDAAARLRTDDFKPITPKRAMTDALTLWCKAREQGKRLVIAD